MGETSPEVKGMIRQFPSEAKIPEVAPGAGDAEGVLFFGPDGKLQPEKMTAKDRIIMSKAEYDLLWMVCFKTASFCTYGALFCLGL